MRSVPAGSFERLSSLEALWAAWHRYRQGKQRRVPVATYDLDADTHVCRLHRQLRSGAYAPGRYRVWAICDPKKRVIAAPAMDDRVVQRALLDDIGPVYERSFVDHSYAVLSGRGPQRAVLAYLRWLRRYRWRLSLDIRRYFLSIHHDTLHALFARRLRDRRTIELIAAMIAAGGEVYRTPVAISVLELESEPVPPGCGLPLGGYLSHWSGGLYLDGLDHVVKRQLGIAAYLRYMDDFALFGNDRVELEDAREAIADWLARERKLSLKPGRDRVQPCSQPSTYLGYRVSRAGISPGPKARRRLRASLRKARSLGLERVERCIRAYRGMMLTL